MEQKKIKIGLDKDTGSNHIAGEGSFKAEPTLLYQARVCCKGEYQQPMFNTQGADVQQLISTIGSNYETVTFPDLLSPLFNDLETCKRWVKNHGYELGVTITRECPGLYVVYEISAEITHIGYELSLGTPNDNRRVFEIEGFDYKNGHCVQEDCDVIVDRFKEYADVNQKPMRITFTSDNGDFSKTFLTRNPPAAMNCFCRMVTEKHKGTNDHLMGICIKEVTEYQGDEIVLV